MPRSSAGRASADKTFAVAMAHLQQQQRDFKQQQAAEDACGAGQGTACYASTGAAGNTTIKGQGSAYWATRYNRIREWREVQLVWRCSISGGCVGGGKPTEIALRMHSNIASAAGLYTAGLYSSSSSLASCNSTQLHQQGGQIGYVPTLYIAPANSLDKHRFCGRVYHYRISFDVELRLFITDSAKFKTLGELVHHHSVSDSGQIFSGEQASAPSMLSMSSTLPDDLEIDHAEITMNNKLGMGQYGDVYEAVWRTRAGGGAAREGGARVEELTVAVKTIKGDAMALPDFLAEAELMKSLSHSNLVQLLGVCTRESPYFILTEFMSRGNLLDFLRASDNVQLPQARAIAHGHKSEALPAMEPEVHKAYEARASFFRSAHFRHWLLCCSLASPLLLLLIGALVAILLVTTTFDLCDL